MLKLGIKSAELAGERFEEERLKKPAGVGKMPLGWTRVRHGLDPVVFHGKRFTKLGAAAPDLRIAAQQVSAIEASRLNLGFDKRLGSAFDSH